MDTERLAAMGRLEMGLADAPLGKQELAQPTDALVAASARVRQDDGQVDAHGPSQALMAGNTITVAVALVVMIPMAGIRPVALLPIALPVHDWGLNDGHGRPRRRRVGRGTVCARVRLRTRRHITRSRRA
jgi:hypothetical protein